MKLLLRRTLVLNIATEQKMQHQSELRCKFCTIYNGLPYRQAQRAKLIERNINSYINMLLLDRAFKCLKRKLAFAFTQ